jgi:hypothetical protein
METDVTDYNDIVRILSGSWNIEAACAIEAQARRIKKLEAVLIPFASYYVTDCTDIDSDYCLICEADKEENNLTVGLFRAAYKVLGEK